MRIDGSNGSAGVALRGLALGASLLLGIGGCDRAPEPAASPPAPATQAAAPPGPVDRVAALPVIDVAGLRALIEQTAAAGGVTVVDFWATWCGPCVAMFPELHAGLVSLKAKGRGVRAVTVTLDDVGTAFERRAAAFLEEHQALYDGYIMPGDGAAQAAFVDELGVRWTDLVVPAILVFDAEGELAGEFLAGPGDVPAILAKVEQLTAGPP